MTDGTVEWFSLDKGYGMISTDDGMEVFMPYSAVLGNGVRYPEAGLKVRFNIQQTSHNYMHATGGMRACDVAPVD
ncbi:cold-shock protein [Lacticaseibacillus zhaodongensis]|uniref:cold-shock protein n=1 Tax=Lacticaseibacillus zhaodongensis TaxID=2668065 RepID=UPI0012D2BD43|nr:cold shock domain-containing protein [Lacticaseibacillus zhaodongensis]